MRTDLRLPGRSVFTTMDYDLGRGPVEWHHAGRLIHANIYVVHRIPSIGRCRRGIVQHHCADHHIGSVRQRYPFENAGHVLLCHTSWFGFRVSHLAARSSHTHIAIAISCLIFTRISNSTQSVVRNMCKYRVLRARSSRYIAKWYSKRQIAVVVTICLFYINSYLHFTDIFVQLHRIRKKKMIMAMVNTTRTTIRNIGVNCVRISLGSFALISGISLARRRRMPWETGDGLFVWHQPWASLPFYWSSWLVSRNVDNTKDHTIWRRLHTKTIWLVRIIPAN